MIDRKINWDRKAQVIELSKPEIISSTNIAPVIINTVQSGAIAVQAKPRITRNRTGKGHKSEMIRKLHDSERDCIRRTFLIKNGQIEEDDCVRIKPYMGNDVAIFQVTGFVSYLHRDVALGRTQVRDLPAYKEWMRTKYSGLFVQYNNPRFTEARHINVAARAQGLNTLSIPISEPIQNQFSTTPSFKAFPRRGTYARTGT
jgi:hypothetical protein